MEVKCFILMCFGDTPEEKEFYSDTYEYLLRPIAIGLGYKETEIDRADISGKATASLAQNYLVKIATAELVIADLSNNSSSVYYELGVRHALVRKRTVILAPNTNENGEKFKVAFDVVNDHHIYRYNPDHQIAILKQESSRLISEIKSSLSSSAYDSPIFHHIPNMKDYWERTGADSDQILMKDDEIAKLKQDLEEYKQKEKQALVNKGDYKIDFESVKREQELYGSEILKKLQKVGQIETDIDKEKGKQEEKDTEHFIKTLEKINESQFIDARSFREIAQLCENRNMIPYAQKILECALQRYPNDDDIRFALIDLYCKSESPQLRMRAVEYSERYYYIEIEQDDKAHFTDKSQERPFTLDRLISLFNAYIGTDNYRRLYSITEDMEKNIELEDPRCQALISRNMGVAEMEQGHYKRAVELFIEACQKDPSERTFALLSNTCYKVGKKEVGYYLREFLVEQEPNEAERYISLVNAIVEYEYIPTGINEDGNLCFDNMGIALRPYEKYLIPLLYKAMICDNCDDIDQQNIISYLTKKFKTKAAKEALDFYRENLGAEQWRQDNYKKQMDKVRESLDFSIVDTIDKKIQAMSDPGYANEEIERIFNHLTES